MFNGSNHGLHLFHQLMELWELLDILIICWSNNLKKKV
jgi:hypothetical protein